MIFVVGVVGLGAVSALTEAPSAWVKPVVVVAFATLLALILLVALRASGEIARPAPDPQDERQAAGPPAPAQSPSPLWMVVVWLLLRRSR